MPDSAEQLQLNPIYEVNLGSQLVDFSAVPEFQTQQEEFRDQALAILANNHQLLKTQGESAVPLGIDVLGTARTLARTGDLLGANDEEYKTREQGLRLDCQRLVAEVRGKLRPKYYEPVRHERNPITGHYYVHGFDGDEVVTNGLSPLVDPEEQDIRVSDYVGQKTKEAIGSSYLAAEGITKLTISPCPDYVIRQHHQDPKRAYAGYVPQVEKLKILTETFDATGCEQEVLAVPGIYYTPEVISEVLIAQGAVEEGTVLNKSEIRSKQLLSTSTEDPLFDFVARLDAKASEKTGLNIFLGEEVAEDSPKDYAKFKAESKKASETDDQLAGEVNDLIVRLEADRVNSRVASYLLDEFLKTRLLTEAFSVPGLAEDVFDQQTEELISAIKALEDQGVDVSGHRHNLYEVAPDVSYCGAGSCGLFAATNATEINQAKAAGLQGDVVVYPEGKCGDCHMMGIYYDMFGNKFCPHCSAFEPA